MWKEIYNQLNIYHKSLSIKDYCKAFIKLINPNDEIWNLESLEDYLFNNRKSDLFPETNYFTEGDYRFVVNYIYHFPNTNKSWLDIDNNLDKLDENTIYKEIFNENSNSFIFKKSIFMPELLLSKNTSDRILTFLFLFFLPSMENYELLYHHNKKIPLLCCHGITDENFNMLLHFMKEYDSFGIKILSGERNLNHILMEEFMDNSPVLYAFDPKTEWDKVLPIYKIHKLLDINCDFRNFEQKMSKKFRYTFENIPEILIGVEKRYLCSKLNEQLKLKEINKEKEQFLKV